jgi:pectin methylesterase-like acyl-CoA thioesterase
MMNRLKICVAALAAAWVGLESPSAQLSLTDQQPAPGAAAVCADTPLRLTFNAPPALGKSGQVKILRASDGKLVDGLNLAEQGQTNLFGTKILHYEPCGIAGNTATIQLHTRALEAATAYLVVVEPGVFQTLDGQAFAGITNGAWRFTTRAALPKGRTRVEVAPDSRGDFCTLQGAVDYIPEDNFTPFEIYVRNGTFEGIAYLGPGRNRVRLVGEDRKKTILTGRNNDQMNSGRMMRPLLSVDADDVTIENLTVRNTTPYKGSQAEALRLSGQRCVVRHCDFYSFQDTLLLNGRVYVADCYVEGDVDFVWGHGTTFFDNCEFKAVHDGYYVTSRNPPDLFGFVFSNCRLTAAPDVKKCWLARIESGRFPGSAVAFLNCSMGDHIPAAGWQITGSDLSRLRFFEYRSLTLEGQPLDISQRHPASHQLTETEAAELSDPNKVLSARDAWKPKPQALNP